MTSGFCHSYLVDFMSRGASIVRVVSLLFKPAARSHSDNEKSCDVVSLPQDMCPLSEGRRSWSSGHVTRVGGLYVISLHLASLVLLSPHQTSPIHLHGSQATEASDSTWTCQEASVVASTIISVKMYSSTGAPWFIC